MLCAFFCMFCMQSEVAELKNKKSRSAVNVVKKGERRFSREGRKKGATVRRADRCPELVTGRGSEFRHGDGV